jgi:hypothetical protein
MKRFPRILPLFLGALFAFVGVARAQWTTQSIALKAGWNAVFLHVDATHDTLANLVAADSGNPITEVWLWAPPAATVQFVQSPQQPIDTSSQWMSWKRASSGASLLQRLVANGAYLVHVSTNVANYTWTIKGRPVPPAYEWSTTGLNLIGVPTVPVGAPTFETFFAHAPELQQNAEVYYYPGGPLGTGNPARLYTLRTTPIRRGQAFWIRSGNHFNRYFAPFETVLNNPRGVEYASSLNVLSFRLRNLTSTNLTVTLALNTSETPPAGQSNIVTVPPILVRGALNITNLTYAYTALPANGTRAWTLAPKGQSGADVEVVLVLNRSEMAGNVGDLHAGLLRLTDSLGLSQVDMPVSATVASDAGLWIGSAVVSQVRESLQAFQRDANGKTLVSTNGQYLVASASTNLSGVPSSLPLRLIVHNPGTGGRAQLLQRVYIGLDAATNSVVSTRESALNRSFLDKARRISASHLPWTVTNAPWAFDGTLGGQTTLKASVSLAYDAQESNPFLHTYHPDHDNLDGTFHNQLPRGSESYTVRRDITLDVLPPVNGVGALSAGGQTVSGNYSETITVLGLQRGGGENDSRSYEIRGVFTLNRISDTSVLTQP